MLRDLVGIAWNCSSLKDTGCCIHDMQIWAGFVSGFLIVDIVHAC